ncbi:MAG: CPBP family intramembrane metalloprotease [Oscillospiraceae bacterium]|nr:CPBP family intramembrane metalloprotease [Oscillospiraceae bacterium]
MMTDNQHTQNEVLNQSNLQNPPTPENEAAFSAFISEKKEEEKDFKKLLYLLSFTVIAVLLLQRLLIYALVKFFEMTASAGAADTAHTAEPVISEFLENFIFFLLWFVNHLVIFVPSFLVFGLAFRKRVSFQRACPSYEFKKSWILPAFLASYFLSAAAIFISNFIEYILRPVFGSDGLRDVFENIMPQTLPQVITMLILVGVVGPICEELIYRHFLLRALRRYGDLTAVIITSLLFGFFHGNLTQFLYTASAGVICAIVAIRANSVIPAIILHVINNLYFVLLDVFYDVAQSSESLVLETVSLVLPWALVIIGLFCFIYFCVKGRFKVENANPYIMAAERVRTIFENPLVLVMIVFLIADTIRGS